jgi:outer membrane protein OmpA-like peptidoglycan-associated protein
MTSSPEPSTRNKPSAIRGAAIVTIGVVVGSAGGFLASRTLEHIEELNRQIASLEEELQQLTGQAKMASQRASDAERSADDALAAQQDAEDSADAARQQAVSADQRAAVAIERAATAQATSIKAQEEAVQARQQAEEARRVAETEMNRLTEALGKIADTRRTALGLVMSLDEGALKFDTAQADLRPHSREVLSRIAGILFTAEGFTITISGHTDARGSETYNQELSERRAQAVADYMIDAGVSSDLFTVEGLGEAHPLDQSGDDEAHAKNRRVELGIVSARIVDQTELTRDSHR